MNDACWHIVEKELNGLTEKMPEQVFNRFVKDYSEFNMNSE
jgi:hypothetical protein